MGDNFWTCELCGEENHDKLDYCSSCGWERDLTEGWEDDDWDGWHGQQ